MARRRMVVAFEAVETPQDRLFRDTFGEPGSVTDKDRRHPSGKGMYWCAADKPPESDSLRLGKVYRTTEVPEEARCEKCGIEIRLLQETFSQV